MIACYVDRIKADPDEHIGHIGLYPTLLSQRIVLAGLWSGFRPLKHCSKEFAGPLGTLTGRMASDFEASRSLNVGGSPRQPNARGHRPQIVDRPVRTLDG